MRTLSTSFSASMAQKLTQWLPADVKPVRPGVYQINGPSFRGLYSYFDGVHWNGGWPTPQNADDNWRFSHVSGWEGCARLACYAFEHTRWRGLSSDPSKG